MRGRIQRNLILAHEPLSQSYTALKQVWAVLQSGFLVSNEPTQTLIMYPFVYSEKALQLKQVLFRVLYVKHRRKIDFHDVHGKQAL